MRFYFLGILLLPFLLSAQEKYPQDTFQSPLDIPIVLAGTFGELRSNHFHSGIDIKDPTKTGVASIGHCRRHGHPNQGFPMGLW